MKPNSQQHRLTFVLEQDGTPAYSLRLSLGEQDPAEMYDMFSSLTTMILRSLGAREDDTIEQLLETLDRKPPTSLN